MFRLHIGLRAPLHYIGSDMLIDSRPVRRTCKEFGYVYGNGYCAHLLGEFAHKTRYGLEDINFARTENNVPMSEPAPNGDKRYWVLEIHILQDPAVGT